MDAKDEEQSQTFGAILRTFAENTSMHGLSSLMRTRNTIFRCLWALLIISSVTTFTFEITTILKNYYSYTTVTTIKVTRTAIEFPDITLCNMRHLDVMVLKNLFFNFNANNIAKTAFLGVQNSFATTFEAAYSMKLIQYLPMWTAYSKSHDYMFREIFSRTNLMENFNLSLLQEAGVPQWELSVVCRWSGDSCNISNISRLTDPYFLNCLTVHAPDDLPVLEGVTSGWSGVSLTGSGMVKWEDLNADDNDYIDLPGIQEYKHPLAGSEGVRIVIHPRGTQPYPSALGFDVPPGFSASIGIRMNKNKALAKPYGNCTQKGSSDKKHPVYRTMTCFRECLSKKVKTTCKCVDSRFEDKNVGVKEDLPFCSHMRNPPVECMDPTHTPPVECLKLLEDAYTSIVCAKDLEEELFRDPEMSTKCECYPPCDEISYDTSVGLSRWPAGQETDLVYREVVKNGLLKHLQTYGVTEGKASLYNEYFNFSNRYTALKEFAKVNVYLADASVSLTEEVPEYQGFQLLSDIGGQLGLWIGMSLLTIGEVLQLLCECLWFLIFKKIMQFGDRSKTQKTMVTPIDSISG